MSQQAPPSRGGPFLWTTAAALALSCGLAVYFLVGYGLARRFRPASPATLLRVAHFSGSWPWARAAWLSAVLLGLALLVRSLALGTQPPRWRRPLTAALLLLALATVVAALFVSPARVQSPADAHFGAVMTDTGSYAGAALLFAVAALLYAGAALVSRLG